MIYKDVLLSIINQYSIKHMALQGSWSMKYLTTNVSNEEIADFHLSRILLCDSHLWSKKYIFVITNPTARSEATITSFNEAYMRHYTVR